jgi:polysaccharide biosynthesis protein PelE
MSSSPAERKFDHLRATVALAGGALAAECLIFGALASGRLSGFGAAALHLFISALLALRAFDAARTSRDARLPLLLSVSVFAMGPFGPMGTLLVIVLTRWHARSAVPFDEWYESLFPELEEETLSHLFESNVSNGRAGFESAEITSFADILTLGGTDQKRRVIALMGRHFRPEFGSLIRRALNDADNFIRVQAASVLNHLENKFLERCVELSGAANDHDPASLLALAAHLGVHSRSGLADSVRETEIRAEAIATYRQYLTPRPGDRDDMEAKIALAQLLMATGDYEEAALLLEEAGSAGSAAPQARVSYMECLFRMNRVAELRAHARRFERDSRDDGQLPEAARAAVQLWACEVRS